MQIFKRKVWVIISKDGKMIAKGRPRHRYLVPVADEKDKKSIITYASKGMAESGFKNKWFFYGGSGYEPKDMEAVEVELTMVKS